MTDSLQLPLTQGVGVEASYGTTTESSISTFTYTPTSNAMNGNTVTPRTATDSGTNGDGSSNWSGYYYYNWYAATAEKGTSSTGAGVTVDGSICPKGWRLPANYSVDDARSWGTLTKVYIGITTTTNTDTGYLTLEATPLSLQRSGFYSNGIFHYGGQSGLQWSSTALSISDAHYFSFYIHNIKPQDGSTTTNNKSTYGFSVRCLAVR